MTLWTALLIAVSVPLLIVAAVWVVPAWIFAEGEFREARRRGALSVGLVMGLIGVRAALDGRDVQVRLLLFRRPSFVFRGRKRPRPAVIRETPVATPPPESDRGPTPGPTPPRARETRPEAPPAGLEGGTEPAPGLEETPPAIRQTPPPVAEGPEGDGMTARVRMIWGYIQRFQRPARRFWGRFRRAFRFRQAACDLSFGAGNPATTGQVCGFLYAVRPLLAPKMRIEMTPDFLGRRFEGEGSLTFRISIARITWAVAALTVRVGGALGWDYVKRRWRKIRKSGNYKL